MKKVSLVGTSRYLGIVLIAMQGILLALLAIFKLNDAYLENWSAYGENEQTFSVYLENISEVNRDGIEAFLLEEADNHQLYIVRKDSSLTKDGSFAGYTYGVYGDTENNKVDFSFLGKTILDSDMISDLLQSEEEEATIGIEKGSAYCLYETPRLRFGEKFVVKKLNSLIQDSGTIQGTYQISGADDEEKSQILRNLAQMCQVTEESLQKPMHGETLDNGLKKAILFVFIAAQMILNFVFFLLIAIKNLDKKGKLALLGWSSGAVCYEIFNCFVWYAIILVPILTIVGALCSGWSEIGVSFLGYFFRCEIVNMVLIVVEIGLASFVQFNVKPLAAIKNKFPKKILYGFGIAGYIGVSIGIVFCGIYLDSPVQLMSENARLSKKWSQVSDYQILKNISIGNDENSFAGTSNELNQNIYDWYRDIADEEGVYLVNTVYYEEDLLNTWKSNNIYTNVPQSPFWYFTFSESYVKQIGLNLSEDVFSDAESGIRVYLMPKNMEAEQKESITAWIEENAPSGIKDGDIRTQFNQEKKIRFVEYDSEYDFFTWGTKETEESTCKMPVIYLCTPENMKYFESESLRAIGLDGYIKFADEDVAKKCLDVNLMEKYNLSDNEMQFACVKEYVDGLQKELGQTLTWFGLVFIIFAMILIGILIALASVFRIANQEKLNVQKFLGFGFWNMYAKPAVGLAVINAAELLVLFFGGSKFGFCAVAIVIFLQWVVFKKYMTKNEIRGIITAFKEA